MKQKSTVIAALIIIVQISIFTKDVFPWTEDTHENLSEYAAESSVLNKDKGDYLKNLGFNKELFEEFKWNNNKRTVKEWLRYGAMREDAGNLWHLATLQSRSFNHFHNPLKQSPWTDAGLDDWIGLLPFHTTGESSLLWAQDGDYQQIFPEKDWSWKTVRNYYYLAITSTTDALRQEYFARTFKGLGHQMHLIQDAAQPDHVRNDAHPMDTISGVVTYTGFEKWAGQKFQNVQMLKNFAPNPVFPNTPLNVSYNNLVPITQFIDADIYNGLNASAGINQGLAEYTNANFFSDDTIFAAERYSTGDRHYFPYPQKTSTDLQNYIAGMKLAETVTAEDGTQDTAVWISKVRDGESVNHLVRPGYFTKTIYNLFGEGSLFYSSFNGDEVCHQDYASRLIPRAVGYSAGLLNYFFRGDIELKKDTVSGSGYVIVNNADEDMNGVFELYYDDTTDNQRKLYWTGTFAIGKVSAGNNKSGNISITLPANASNYILVFRGALGNESNAVAGRVWSGIYFIIMPFDHVTRQGTGKNYYYYNGGLAPISETNLPFGVIDDGGYWDSMTSTWTAKAHPASLGVPLSTGGPQYIAKYRDDVNNRIRFITNESYEKNAYQGIHKVYTISGQTIKDFHYVVFRGSPLLGFGAYEENTGYMEYMEDPNSPGTYGVYSLIPIVAANPQVRYFSWYNSDNFVDTFLEYDAARFYRFNNTIDVQAIPQDAEAPFRSVAAVSKTGSGFKVELPKIFNYTRPNPYWTGGIGYGSSGIDSYTAQIGTPMGYSSSANKCIAEDSSCGNISQGSSSVNTVFDIPYNFNSYIRVHLNDGGRYYEELYINGQKVETSSASTTKLETHYQILAVYKNTAVIRETQWVSRTENPLQYMYKQIIAGDGSIITPRIYETVHNFTAAYYIYINGNRYNLNGQTTVQSKGLDFPYYAKYSDSVSGLPKVEYLTFEYAEDITGYHIDRLFINDSFDGSHILVVFDEYSYNNGEGLVHNLNYSASDNGNGKYFLYYDIPVSKLQGASHEALPVGRKILLFNSNGTLENTLQDPIGLSYSIGSIGILN